MKAGVPDMVLTSDLFQIENPCATSSPEGNPSPALTVTRMTDTFQKSEFSISSLFSGLKYFFRTRKKTNPCPVLPQNVSPSIV